jgi:Mg2+/Co2+ transporter CorB
MRVKKAKAHTMPLIVLDNLLINMAVMTVVTVFCLNLDASLGHRMLALSLAWLTVGPVCWHMLTRVRMPKPENVSYPSPAWLLILPLSFAFAGWLLLTP